MDALMIYIGIWIISFTLGFIAGKLHKKEKSVGTLVIDHESIPEDEPYLFLQSRVNPKELIDKKTVAFDVVVEKFISQD